MADYINFICSIISVLFIGIQKGKKEAHYSIGFTCFLFIVGRDGSGVQSWAPHPDACSPGRKSGKQNYVLMLPLI